MLKRISLAGAPGGVALLIWTFVANVFFGVVHRRRGAEQRSGTIEARADKLSGRR